MASADPRHILLDVTRLVSRVGGGPATGIDRVERAILRGLLDRGFALTGLCRVADGFALIEAPGLMELRRRFDGEVPWGGPDLAGRLSWRLPAGRRAAESDVRRLACGKAGASGLGGLLRTRLPEGTAYLNAGHSNLTDAVLRAVRALPSSTAAVLIHDTIPLRLPWTQRAGASGRFRERLRVVASHADTVICTSGAEATHVATALGSLGRTPPTFVAPLGLDREEADPGAAHPEGPPSGPYFVAVGTLEPRKNIGLLLDVWEHMADAKPSGELPGLSIVGRRGWESDRFFRRLDALKSRIPELREHGPASDGERRALVSGARALLFPSLAEGYGLPPLEALTLGVTPICAPLPVYRETMADAAVYADPGDMYQWASLVDAFAAGGASARRNWKPPSWDDHLNAVLAAIG